MNSSLKGICKVERNVFSHYTLHFLLHFLRFRTKGNDIIPCLLGIRRNVTGLSTRKSYPFCSITWQTTSGTEFPAKIPAVLIFIPLPKEFKISCAIRLRHISLLLTISIFFIQKFYFYLFPDIATLITPSNLFSKIR